VEKAEKVGFGGRLFGSFITVKLFEKGGSEEGLLMREDGSSGMNRQLIGQRVLFTILQCGKYDGVLWSCSIRAHLHPKVRRRLYTLDSADGSITKRVALGDKLRD
jgi:hypothetical protein